jgi:hypothetical protein
MLQPQSRMLAFIGFTIWGDLGPLTIYRSRRRKLVAYKKAPPDKPASELQAAQREKFRQAKDAWNDLDADVKARWNAACLTLSLPLTGYNLWIFWKLTADDDIIQTIERQSRQTLL